MDDAEYELNKSDFGGASQWMDGDGGNTNLGRTDFELESVDTQNEQGRAESYKVIRTGEDEMAFFLNDNVDQPIEQGVLVKRGKKWLVRKR